MSRRSSVILVDTAPRSALGSMSRHARLVEAAVRRCCPDVQLERLCLGMPAELWRAFPARLAPWVHHAWLWGVSRGRLQRIGSATCHVLDGSYAYVARNVPASQLLVTAHDLIPYLQLSGVLEGRPGPLASAVIGASVNTLRQAACIMAGSDNTRRDVCSHLGVPAGRVSRFSYALEPSFACSDAGVPPVSSRKPWVLHVGNNAGYKNRLGVLKVFEQMKPSGAEELVLVGPPPNTELKRQIAASPVARQVRVCCNPDDAALGALYGQARVLLFPSIYEGFGWPIVEAMAAGCPVVCSTAASLPEVAGDAALTASVDDVAGLAAHCRRVMNDDVLAADLAKKGRLHTATFTLERMGQQLCAAYANMPKERP